ncbi:heme ABC transporter ATP-binding protein [Actinoplanes sp. OR16]|uniref:ABC transporter ATP-binding protein n=1 Tax=Actinoplanes sp. OR16 TaxID=946334 RepID=UPI000F6BD50C|nr:energy-coupling factor transporter ATPase [Actinoplanes sp. OR16]BBH68185.1 heme ABC transporter ATP-binding protein [Actinoplanes sp. OR16]
MLQLTGVSVRHEIDEEWGPARPQNVTAEINAGEVVLLLGPSGCGKSTLTLTVNGLIPQVVDAHMDGTVRVGDHDTRTTPVPRMAAEVAMVFQDPDAQIVTATVLDEVCFGPENLLLPPAEVEARAEDALRRVGLWERRDEEPDRLSGGGRQRLAIACALALRTPVLVLDEPTANLDPSGVEEVFRTLRDITADRDRAVLLVEHNLDAAIDLVDRVIVLDAEGRVVLDGPARETLRENADHLLELGVWLPAATLAALRLREAGIVFGRLPLTPAELAAALDATATLPALLRDPEGGGRDRMAGARDLTTGGRPAIAVRGLSVFRGSTRILDGVDLDIAAGEFVAVVGSNGAGKTTLAQALAGVITTRRGAVTADGLDPVTADPRVFAERVGFVFQNPEHQFVTSRVDDELTYGLRVRGVPAEEAEARAGELLDRLGLRELRTTHPFLISGGQKRRLSVGAALITRPHVLVLDEPTFGQDRERAAELLSLLDGLHADGTTIVVVSHDMTLVAEHATRVLVLDGGRIAGDGTPAEIYADADLLEATGLRPPPLARAARALVNHPEWHGLTRLADLPALETTP